MLNIYDKMKIDSNNNDEIHKCNNHIISIRTVIRLYI